MAEMRTGATISGLLHGGLIAVALFGADWLSGGDPPPLTITEVEFIDSADFEARLSTAPVIENEGPAEMMPPQDKPEPELAVDQAETQVARAEVTPVEDGPPPEPQPDEPEIVLPPPPTEVPTEAPKPSIAEIPSPDPLERQALAPESPVSTEPVQPLASAPSEINSPKPSPPPPPDPEALAEAVEPPPEETDTEPEPDSLAEAQPDAPEGAAPQEAKLPVAKPAELAAAAEASSAPKPKTAEKEAEEKTAEAKPAAAQAEERQASKPKDPSPAGGNTSKFAAKLTRGEKEAFQLSLKRHFRDPGRFDPGLWVKIEIRLSADGRITAGPTSLGGGGGDTAAQKRLYDVGRRTLKKAEAAGEFARLPADKYDGWKTIHVTFTPDEVGISS